MMTEAPASISYTLKSPNGYSMIMTMRGEDIAKLVPASLKLETKLKELGYTAEVKGYGKPKAEKVYVEGRTCPKCGGRLVDTTTKAGKLYKCEHQKWDYTTKQTTGCDFTEWQNATLEQKGVLEVLGVWREGMTKEEATKLIREKTGK